jgi:hypothetical protein
LALALAACDLPNYEGPQLQDPPSGFLLVQDSYSQRLITSHESIFHVAWVESVHDFSTIFIDGYPAVLGYEDALAAREESRRVAVDPDVTFGEVEPLTIDGRSSWGWAERVQTPSRGLAWVAYRALVPYDSVTYFIEFASGNPAFKRAAPDTLKAVISTFAIGRVTYNVPLIALGVGLLLFGAAVVRTKRQERAARMKSINLVKVARKPAAEPEASAPPEPVGAVPAAPAVPDARPFPDSDQPTNADQHTRIRWDGIRRSRGYRRL